MHLANPCHDASALRLRQVCLAAPALAPLVPQLQHWLGLGRPYADPHVAHWGLHNAVFTVGAQCLEVVAPSRADAPLWRFLGSHPQGAGYIVILNDPQLDARRQHLAACGARLVTDMGVPGFHTLQVHPRDAGACMLEFNHTQGDAGWAGPYAPGGPDWQPAAADAPVRGISHVVLRADDPAALAQRWAQLTGCPLQTGPDGAPLLRLDGGCIGFAASAPGTPAGLAEVGLRVHDAPALLARAASLGLALDLPGQAVQAAGVCFKLLSEGR